MLAASKVKMSGREKKNRSETNTTFPPQKVYLGRFWKFHVVVVQNNGKDIAQKLCCTRTCNVVFVLLFRPIVFSCVFLFLFRFFFWPFSLLSPLIITRFYIFLSKLLILTRASHLALAKCIII